MVKEPDRVKSNKRIYLKNENLIVMEHINWKGEWISDESPFDKASEYSLKQDLIKELLEVAEKYKGLIKDKTIAEAADEVARKYALTP
jgi:hypothetical protein